MTTHGGRCDYRIFIATSTGYFAVEKPSGQLWIYPANQPQVIPACQAIAFWSCAGASDPRPAGEITLVDCQDTNLIELDVRGHAALRTLDCSGNLLTELDLAGLVALENLYCQGNPLAGLDLSPGHSLKFIRYASRYLGYSEVVPSGLIGGQVLHDGPFFFVRSDLRPGLLNTTNDTRCAEKYLSRRKPALAPEGPNVRAIAYALKKAAPGAIAVAAPAMAALIDGPCWLIPIPAANGSTNANLALAREIAALVPGARVKLGIERSQPVESSTARRRRGLAGLQPHEHHFVRTAGPMNPFPVYFVDNVITTGNTIRAARAALGWGTGLAFADASTPFNNRVRECGTQCVARSQLVKRGVEVH